MSTSDSKDTKLIFDFDPTKPVPKLSVKASNLPYSHRSLALNKYALLFLQELKWPKEILFIFQSECEARLCMRTIFPDPDLVSKVLKVRVHIMPLRDIDWSFQSSQSGFENFPSKPLNKILGPELGIECIEEGSIRIHPNEKAEVRVQVYGEEITCIKKTKLTVRGLERTDSCPIQIDERVIQFGFCLSLQNTSWDTVHIRPGDILGNVSEAIRAFGATAFLTLDLERKRLRVESKYQVSNIENFDTSKGLPEMWKNNMQLLNKHSVSLLQLLKNPKSMLLIFKTEREASLCLKSLFPNPALIETKKMRICIQVIPFNETLMNFQSTLNGSRR